MKHLDLFSGIGGFALAADKVFGEVEHTFVEYDPFCQTIIRKHWPHSQIYGDIRQFIADTESNRFQGEGRGRSFAENTGFTILTGGFPCQPFSQAGRRKGTEDDRYLWPEMFRVIQLYKPTWVIAENVRGLVTWSEGMVLEQVCADLEREGYEVQPFIIPAVAVNAPHRRDRVWIIARHSDGNGLAGRGTEIDTAETGEPLGDASGRHTESGETSPDPRQQLRSERSVEGLEADTTERATGAVPDKRGGEPDWERDWREVALATCHDGVDDGISRRMGDVTISGARHRKEGLKACGNAIVPAVAMRIMEAISKDLK